MKPTITIIAALLLGACTPATICNRETQTWNKFNTEADDCEAVHVFVKQGERDGPDGDPDDDVIVIVIDDEHEHEDNGGGNGVDPAPGGSDDGNGDLNGDGEI